MTLATTLQTFISNAFYGFFVQDDDKIAEDVYEHNWSKDVQEVNDGQPLNFQQFYDLVFHLSAKLTNRFLVDQSFVVAPADTDGNTGQVAHISHSTASSEGKEVKITIVSVLKIVLVKVADKEELKRQVLTESFVFTIS